MVKRTLSLLTAIFCLISCLGLTPVSAAETTVAPGVGTLKAAVIAASSGDTLVLTDGTYYVDETLTISKPISIVAESGTLPTITGSNPLTGWESVGDGIYRAAYTGNALPMLIEAGTTATIARYPNKPENTNFTSGYIFATGAGQNVGAKTGYVTFTDSSFPTGIDAAALQMVTWGDAGSNYANTAVAVSAVSGNRVDYTGVMKYGVSENTRFYIRGDKALIDQTGEYALSGGYIYYKPYDVANLETEISVSKPFGDVIKITASGVTLFGLAIKGTALGTYNSATAPHSDQVRFMNDNMALNIIGSDTVIDSCYFDGIGSLAVKMGGSRNTVKNSKFMNIGSAALDINGANHLITNNEISNTGTENGGGAAIGITAQNTTVSHNAIYNNPRWAINIGYGGYQGNIIEYNDVYNNDTDSSDTGPIYAYQTVATAENPNIIRYNKVRNNPIYGGMGFGIYLDDDCQYFKVYGNAVYGNTQSNQGHLAGPIMIKGTAHEVYNNIIANNQGNSGINNAGNIFIQQLNDHNVTRDNKLHHNVFFNPGHTSMYRIILRNNTSIARAIAECDYNFYADARHIVNSAIYSYVLNDQWTSRAGFDRNSRSGNPGFVDGNANDFRLLPTSPLHDMGFASIPLDKIGLTAAYPYADQNDTASILYVTETGDTDCSYEIIAAVGEEKSLSAIMRTEKGYAISVAPTYSSNNEAVATVDVNGNLDIKTVGSAVITATYGGETTQVLLTVSGYADMGTIVSRVEYMAPSGNAEIENEGTLPAGTTGFKVFLKKGIADNLFSNDNFKVYCEDTLVDGYTVTKESETVAVITLPAPITSVDGSYKLTVEGMTSLSGAYASEQFEISSTAAQLNTLLSGVYYVKDGKEYRMTDGGKIELGATAIRVKFVSDIKENTITADSVTLEKDGANAISGVSVSGDTVVLTLSEAVSDEDAVYVLTLASSIETVGGEAASEAAVFTVTAKANLLSVTAPAFKTLAGGAVSGVPASTTLHASVEIVNSYDEAKPVLLVVVLKDSYGRAVKLSYVQKTVGAHEATSIGAGLTTPANTSGLTLHAYLWNSTDNLVPLN